MTQRLAADSLHGVYSFFRKPDVFAIASMLVIGGLVYGVFITSLGFYWDDWPVVWVYNALGQPGIAKYFAGQRPVYGWIIGNLASILGLSPAGWQLVAFAVRCASSIALFIAFSALWPRRKDIAWLTGTLALLYPGFTLQPIALGFIPYFLSFALFTASLAATIFSMTKPANRWLCLCISLITAGLSYLVIEYFVGLELFRLLIIAFLMNREHIAGIRKKLSSTLIAWSPYAALCLAYTVWRAFIFRIVSHYAIVSYMDVKGAGSTIQSNPVHELWTRFLIAIHNIFMSTIIAWSRPFSPSLVTLNQRTIHSWIIAFIVAAIAILTLRWLRLSRQDAPEPELLDDESHHVPESGLLLGALGLCVAGLPLVVPALSVEFTPYPFSFADRFTLSFLLPASLMLACLLSLIGTRRSSIRFLAPLVILVFTVFQVQNESLYRQDWQSQKSLLWQLAWRAPALKPGTSVMAEDVPRSLFGNHSAGLLNMLYNRNDSAGRLNYFIFDLSQLSADQLSGTADRMSYIPGDLTFGRLRSFQFQGTTTQSLVAWISPGGTIRVVTQPYANEILRGSTLCINIAQLSRPETVISDAPALPGGPLLSIFGSEPKHEWPYFYQKAELDRQLQRWSDVSALGDEAMKQEYEPDDPSEWFPFIEGYARTRRYKTAVDISNRIIERYPDAVAPLSSLWQRVKREDLENSAELSATLRALGSKLVLQDEH